MYGEVSAVAGSVVYFLPGGSKSIFAFTFFTNKWSERPECPNSHVNLVMVNSLLTAIGGITSNHEVTKSLLSLNGDKWTKQFLPCQPSAGGLLQCAVAGLWLWQEESEKEEGSECS